MLIALSALWLSALSPAAADPADESEFPAQWWTDGLLRAYSITQGGNEIGVVYHRVDVIEGDEAHDRLWCLHTKLEVRGADLMRSGTIITYDEAGEPVTCEVANSKSVVMFEFHDDSITVHRPDGTTTELADQPRMGLLDSNNIMAMEMILSTAEWPEVGGTATRPLRESARLQQFDYAFTFDDFDEVSGYATLTDMLGETITWSDASGIVRVEAGAVAFELVDAEWPDWPVGPTGEPFVYAMPKDATFTAEEVRVERPQYPGEPTGAGGFELAGTYNLPDPAIHGEGPYPAVYFHSGSGPADRHGWAAHAYIDCGTWEILDAIANAGFAVLRIDDRGAGESGRGGEGMDSYDFDVHYLVNDGRACVEWLIAREEVDPSRVFVIGHSEGATIAPMIEGKSNIDLAGIVAMAGCGRNLQDVVYDQVYRAVRVLGGEYVEERMRVQAEITDAMREGRAPDFDIVDEESWNETRGTRAWMASHFRLDLRKIYSAVACPVLVIQGESDFQVQVEDARIYAKYLAMGECTDVTLRILPDLDHMFKPCGGRESTMDMYREDRRVDPPFIDILVNWLVDHARD